MKTKSQYLFVLIILTALILGSCSSAHSPNVTVTSIAATPSAQVVPTDLPSSPTAKPAPTEIPASPTPEFSVPEMTDAMRQNPKENIAYTPVTREEFLELVDSMKTDIKNGKSKVNPRGTPVVGRIEKMNDGLVRFNCNALSEESIYPWYAVEIDGVQSVMYEVLIAENTSVVITLAEARNVPDQNGKWSMYTTIVGPYVRGERVHFLILLRVPKSSNSLDYPFARSIMDVNGEPGDPIRERLETTGVLDADMGETIFDGVGLRYLPK
jgi:hypothetical protein